jgi:hypothetical protein
MGHPSSGQGLVCLRAVVGASQVWHSLLYPISPESLLVLAKPHLLCYD